MHHLMMLPPFLWSSFLWTWGKKWKKWFVDWHLLCFLSIFTPKIECSECCVGFQCITQWCRTCATNVIVCLFDVNDAMVIYQWILFVCCFFCLYHSSLVSWVSYLISVHHSMMLLLCLQCHCLMVVMEEENGLLLNTFFMFFFYLSDRAWWVLCLISVHHSMMLLLCLQLDYLFVLRMIYEFKGVFCVSSDYSPGWARWESCSTLILHTVMLILFLQCCFLWQYK